MTMQYAKQRWRAMSLMLVLALVISLFTTLSTPITAYGFSADTSWDGSGTVNDPYKITNADELAGLAQEVNSGTSYGGIYFLQTAEIDLNDDPWTPIGKITNGSGDPLTGFSGKSFRGNFDGNGLTISGLNINSFDGYSTGLFGFIGSGATIENVNVAGNIIFSSDPLQAEGGIGCVVGVSLPGSVIDHCSANVNINVSINYASGFANLGGIVGRSGGIVRNCFIDGVTFSASDTSPQLRMGGIAGRNDNTLENCYATNITLTATGGGTYVDLGSIVGIQVGIVDNCFAAGNSASGTPSSSVRNGILVGRSFSALKNSYFDGATAPVGSTENHGSSTNVISFAGIGILATPSSVGNTTSLLDTLNAWVETKESADYYSWVQDSGSLPKHATAVGLIKVSPAALNFGSLTVSTSATKSITVTNTATSKNITYATPAGYSIEKAAGWSDVTGGTLNVTFMPTAVSSYPGIINFSNTIMTKSALLSGSGVSAPPNNNPGGGSSSSSTVNASISSKSESYDPETGDTISVTLTKGNHSLIAVLCDGKALTAGKDYTVNDSKYAFTESFLNSLSSGEHKIMFDMSAGTDPVLTLTIADSTQGWHNPFTDVKPSDWYYDDVEYVLTNGLFNGTSQTTFSPGLPMNRGMIIAVLWRMDNEPKAKSTHLFSDIKSNAYFYDAAMWGAENELIKGYSDDIYGPSDNLTREQVAALLWRYAKYKGYDVSSGENTNILSYDDFADISEYAIAAMQWACGEELIKGTSDGHLNPKGNATRAEVAAILHRFIETSK